MVELRKMSRAVLTGVCCLCFAQEGSGPARTLATFQIREYFGVAWPDQPVDFRYDKGRPRRT